MVNIQQSVHRRLVRFGAPSETADYWRQSHVPKLALYLPQYPAELDMLTSIAEHTQPVARPHVLRTVIVAGQPGQELPDSALETVDYDIVILEPLAHAYSQIKRMKPMLVILTMAFDDVQGCQLMSMLKLDPETASIPIRAYAALPVEADEDETDETDDFIQTLHSAIPN